MIRREPSRRKRDKVPVKRTRRTSRARSISDTLTELDQLDAASPKAKAMIELFRGWLTDESGYDEETWPTLKSALNRERGCVGVRGLFGD